MEELLIKPVLAARVNNWLNNWPTGVLSLTLHRPETASILTPLQPSPVGKFVQFA